MALRRPKENKSIIPIDTNVINAFVEIEKAMQEKADMIDSDPLILPNHIFTDKTTLTEDEENKINKNKLVCFALYKIFKLKKSLPFISPTVLNEVRNISIPNERKLFLDFIKQYGVMPAVDYENGQPVLSGQEDAEKLAQLYCEPYDYTIMNDGKEITRHSYRGPMEFIANENIFDKSPKKPSADAFVMSWPAVYSLSLITLNEKHFINVNYGDTIRRKGIKNINKKFLESSYSTPIPYSPSDLYSMFIIYQKRKSGIYTTEESDFKNFHAIDVDEFFWFILSKFPKLDISFFDTATKVIEIANLEDITETVEKIEADTDENIDSSLEDDLNESENYDETV